MSFSTSKDDEEKKSFEKFAKETCPEYKLVQSQCGPNRDPLNILSIANSWCHGLHYEGVTLKKLCNLQKEIPIIYPWTPTYNSKRLLFNKLVNQFPAGIVFAQNAKDIQIAIKFAQQHKIPIAIRSGGHSLAGFSTGTGFVIDLSQMNKVQVLPEKEIAIVGAGCTNGQLIPQLQKYGFVIPTGSCFGPSVMGVMGVGGVGFLDRLYGLTADNVVRIEAVLADGSVITASEKENFDFFWAVRGGGPGSFGIITRVAYRLRKLSNVFIFTIAYNWEKAAQAIKIFQKWAPFASRCLTTELALKGKDRGVIFTGQWEGTEEGLEEELKALKPLGKPIFRDVKMVSIIDAAKSHADNNMRPPLQKVKSSFVFEPISDKGVDVLVEWAGKIKKEGESDAINLAALGGAILDKTEKYNAYPARKAIYWLEYQFYWLNQYETESKIASITAAWEAVRPFASPFCYLGFPDLQIKDYKFVFWNDVYNRLVTVKRQYDPTDFFKLPQGIRLRYEPFGGKKDITNF